METMNQEEFKDFVEDHVRDYLPENFANAMVERHIMRKIGSIYDGLILQKPGLPGSAVANLDALYERYENGESVHNLLTDTAKVLQIPVPILSARDLQNYEAIKDKLFVRVCNVDANEALLTEVPHRRYDGIALTYHIRLNEEPDRLMSTTITYPMMQALGVSEYELNHDALSNGERMNPPVIESLKDRLFGKDAVQNDDDYKLLVVTNEAALNGAAVLFYPGIQNKIAEKIGGNYFVIPSSTHEILALKDTGDEDFRSLEQLLWQMNATVVSPEDVLANKVYHYDFAEKVFEKAEHYETRMVEKIFDTHIDELLEKFEIRDEESHESAMQSEQRTHSFSMKM